MQTREDRAALEAAIDDLDRQLAANWAAICDDATPDHRAELKRRERLLARRRAALDALTAAVNRRE